ncbi:hypothetical protein [Aneurinibacillus danicus]|uniref:hypothetical protein n=1 Tax=Aneurinibacillus danicus TaxID=267746 RepID=UPI0011BE7EE3|nr:hypothetical protein [Aneurinibacillus danicus]
MSDSRSDTDRLLVYEGLCLPRRVRLWLLVLFQLVSYQQAGTVQKYSFALFDIFHHNLSMKVRLTELE